MKHLIVLSLVLLCSIKSWAFSPYENRMRFDDQQRIGLIAFADQQRIASLKQLVGKIAAQPNVLHQQGIFNLSIYLRNIKHHTMVFAYFESPDKSINGWSERLATASPSLRALSGLLTPHKRANKNDIWLRMEWMNLIASSDVFPYPLASAKTTLSKMGLVSGLKPQHELS